MDFRHVDISVDNVQQMQNWHQRNKLRMARTATATAASPTTISPSTTDEEIDSVAAATCTKIQAEARKITIRLEDVKDNLICPLCEGYFYDAHKIKECAHTFCSGCIRDYFSHPRNVTCPICAVNLAPRPWEKLIADPAYQSIVDKLLPDFAIQEEHKRRAFYERHGFSLKAKATGSVLTEPATTTASTSDEPSDTSSTTTPPKQVEKISFELHALCGPGTPLFLQLEKLKQPRMSTDASFRIHSLRKFLALKLNLASPNKVEILCRGRTVGGEYSLAFVRRTIWDDPKTKMILEYRGTVV